MRITSKFVKEENLTVNEVMNFKFKEGNRPVEETSLKKIIKDLYDPETHTWNQVKPIEVNILTNNILDGQHRWKGFITKVSDGSIPQDSTIGVHFVEIPEDQELEYIDIYNQGKHWNLDNHIGKQIVEGNENSRKLRTFCEEHELCHTVKGTGRIICNFRGAAAILTGGRKETNLKKGEFEFPEENRLLAETVHDELVEILSIFPTWTKGKANIEAMAKAWYEVRGRYEFKVWKKAFKYKENRRGPMTMSSTAANSWKQYFAQCAGTIALGEAK